MVAGGYVIVMVLLGLHLYHGIWSMTQTLDWDTPRLRDRWRAIAAVSTLVIVVGFVSVPVAVLAGVVEEPAASVTLDAERPTGAVTAHVSSDADPHAGTDAGSVN